MDVHCFLLTLNHREKVHVRPVCLNPNKIYYKDSNFFTNKSEDRDIFPHIGIIY